MDELIEKLRERKRKLEGWLEGPFTYEGSHDYATTGLVDQGRSEAQSDEIQFLTALLSEFESAEQPLTPELVEAYGFVPDEPGYWFLESDGEIDMTVRLELGLRQQGRWRLVIDGGEGNDDVNVEVRDLKHLLAILEEHGYEFYEDKDEEGGEDE